MGNQTAVLLLPRTRQNFILHDQAEDLLRSGSVIAVEPHGVPYGVFGRLPRTAAKTIAHAQAKRMRFPAPPRVVVIFHPFQYPLAAALLERFPKCELWYGRWDRYEHAYDAGGRTRSRLRDLHEQAANRSTLTFVASEKLADLEREAGRDAVLVPLAADSFPTPTAADDVVAVSLGHLGWRTDWSLLAAVAEAMPELTVLLVGEWHEKECRDDPDFVRCRELPNLVWLGHRPNEEAARLIGCADVGLVPFKTEPFNDAGLPYRILKYARLGRRTIAPDLAGLKTWSKAVTCASTVEQWIEALRAARGTRCQPDLELREWALAQTAEKQNAPLWERLRELGLTQDN